LGILQALQQPLEEPLGGFRIPSVLHKDIENHAALIHGTPQVMLNALDPDEHLVEVPLVSRPRPTAAQSMGKALAEFPTPAPHRLIGHNDASLSQQLMTAMSQERRLAREYVENFSRPDRQWERFGSSERIRDWLDETRTQALRLAAVTANS
jgi:hypothetical protein